MITFKHERNILRRLNNGMEIDLGVNVKRSARDLTFISVESESVFVLLGHLPGYMQDKIEASINEVRQEICISGVGDKASMDMAIGGRLWLKNELEINSFEKVFGIPDSVALDQIEVCFNEEDAILMILMPKSINIEGEVGERASGKVDEDELNRNGLDTNTHQEEEEDEETKNEEVHESNKEFDLPQRPSVEIEAPNIGEQLPPSFGVKAKEEQKHNGQPLKENESPRTSKASQALQQPKISPNIDKEQEDKKGGVGKSHELDNNPIDESDLPQQLTEELEMNNKDKLPLKEVKGKGREMEKGEVGKRETQEIDKEREAFEVNQTLGHPKISQHIDKEHEEEQEKHEDRKRDVAEEQIRELPRQRIQDLETSKKDELPTKEMKGKRRKIEQGGLGVPPPSLVVSAFLVSLAALVIKLVRNQKRT